MKLTQRLTIKERQAQLARNTFFQSYEELKRVLYRKFSSRTALVIGFSSGMALGWLKRKRRPRTAPLSRSEPTALLQKARRSMPKHWLGSYIVWPFLLATARDLVIARRPSRGN